MLRIRIKINPSMIPKCTRYVFFAVITVFAILLFMVVSALNNIWLHEDDENSDTKTSTSPIHDVLKRNDLFSVRKANSSSSSLKLEPADPCYKKYGLNILDLFDDPHSFLKSAVREEIYIPLMMTISCNLATFLKVKVFIIEPSVLYCMLPINDQELLIRRNFNISKFSGSPNVITLGMLEDDASILQQNDIINRYQEIGLHSYFVEEPLASWMNENNTGFKEEKFTSHIFYSYYEWTLHIVVFYNRNEYLWHSALRQDDRLKILKDELLFVDYDSAYEKFSFDPFGNKSENPFSLSLPSSPQYFLLQIPSSKFLECNSSRAVYVLSSTSSPKPHLSLSQEEFENRTVIAIRELKTLLNPLLMNFWLSSGTLLGWYRQCGLIPYTTDIDFGAWASEVENINYITKYFRRNKKLFIIGRMGFLKEALEFQLRTSGLRVDLFFMYKINNGSWSAGHDPSRGYYFRYYFPHFTLCSAELLRQKVQVPCEAEDIIRAEYGSEWMHPISSWSYISSTKNRGPNIYWKEKRRAKAFLEY